MCVKESRHTDYTNYCQFSQGRATSGCPPQAIHSNQTWFVLDLHYP